jgi:hypothetical protein
VRLPTAYVVGWTGAGAVVVVLATLVGAAVVAGARVVAVVVTAIVVVDGAALDVALLVEPDPLHAPNRPTSATATSRRRMRATIRSAG